MKYRPGQKVRVREGSPAGHVRTPGYVRGKRGWVAKVHGAYRNPESLAYGGEGLPKQPLYYVGFRQAEVWSDYKGSPADTIYVDIYEHWLEA